MSDEASFFFYLGAVVCFALAAIGEAWKYGGRSRRGLKPAVALLPLGLLLWLFPLLWTTAESAW